MNQNSENIRGRGLLVGLVVLVLWLLTGSPALAHGEDGEVEAVELVEQALAILVNSPGSVGEARERIEAALAADPAELEGLDVQALNRALDAIAAGDAHAAEDALVEALGRDPHPGEAVEPASGATATTNPPTSTRPTSVEPVEEVETSGEMEEGEEQRETGLFATPSLDHGLTERVEGGVSSPGMAVLVSAVILAAVGTFLLRRRETMP